MIELPEKKYFSIGEASRMTGVKQYVLRYWESQFRLVRPSRRESGQRKYTQEDINTILRVRELLYEKRYTIEGAKKYLLDEKKKTQQQQRKKNNKEENTTKKKTRQK